MSLFVWPILICSGILFTYILVSICWYLKVPSRVRADLSKRKSKRLLISFIGEAAYERARRFGQFVFRSPSNPQRFYRINFSGLGRIEIWEIDEAVHSSCILPSDPYLPPADRVLAHFLHIRTNEPAYLKLAFRGY